MQRREVLAGIATVAGAGCLGREASGGPSLERHRFDHGDHERTYLRWAPDPSTVEGSVPLVVVLHGGTGTARRVARTTGFPALARREGAVAVFPDGLDGRWNDGRRVRADPPHGLDNDDVGFLQEVIDRQVERLPVDPGRVYLTGISAGAMMSLRFAIERPDAVAAVAPVSSSLPVTDEYEATPEEPIAVALLHGTQDPLSPYEGGPVGPFGNRGTVLGVPETVERFRRAADCSGPPSTETQSAGDVRVDHAVYPGCSARVEEYRLVGGGHGWPGREQGAFELLLGPDVEGFDATGAIWTFFTERA